MNNRTDTLRNMEINRLQEKCTLLEKRLNRGWDIIKEAEAQGDDTSQYDNTFLEILKEYCTTFDRIKKLTSAKASQCVMAAS